MKSVFFVGAAFAVGVAFPAGGAELRAGLARIDITPSQPVRMAGYESRKDLSQGIHDPLSARAVAFEQSGQKLVLVSVDTLGFYNRTAPPFRQAILEACQLKPAELFLCAIHTHSAPTLTLDAAQVHTNNYEYTRGLQAKLVEVVKRALEQLGPVQIGVGIGSSPVGVNRREMVQDKSGETRTVLGRNPSALTDRQVQVLKLVRSDQAEIAGALFAYATHSTSLGPRNYLISGDIHGLAEQFLERYLGAQTVAPGFAGASGNIDPWVRVLPDFRTNNGWMPEPVLMGTMLGEEVARVLESVRQFTNNSPIKTLMQTVDLPAKQRGAAPGTTSGTTPLTITVGRLGEIAFVGLGGEVFNEIGKAIKDASPFEHTFIMTHCNASSGYLPTRPSYEEGGYEVQSSSFGPGAAERVIEQAGRMLIELKQGAS